MLPTVSVGYFLRILEPALIIALIGSIDTLLVLLVLDSISGERHKPNRELLGQGVGNLASGLLGGAPGGITVGALVNVRAGGRSPLAGVISTLILLAAVLGLATLLERIPVAALAAILIRAGWDILDRGFVKRIHRISRAHAVIMLSTLLLGVFIGFMTSVVAGLVFTAYANARRMEQLEARNLISVPLLDRHILSLNDVDEHADPFEARAGLIVFPDRLTVVSAREVIRAAGPRHRRTSDRYLGLFPYGLCR